MTENQLKELIKCQKETQQVAFKSFVYRIFIEIIQKLKYIEKYEINESRNYLYFYNGLSIEISSFLEKNYIEIIIYQNKNYKSKKLYIFKYYPFTQTIYIDDKLIYTKYLVDAIFDFIKPYLTE